jgi:toxin FitB
MKVLDTNVVSELLRPKPDSRVINWIATLPATELFITAVTEAELRYGIAVMPNGKRKNLLADIVHAILREDFASRILPFDSEAATEYAAIVAHRRAGGKKISEFDAQIAAIARAKGADALATRNVNDFLETGLTVVNPWEACANV